MYELSNPAESRGGGPLFGVNGVSVVGHGRARSNAVRRAVGTAKLVVETGFISKLNRELDRVRTHVGE